MTTKDLLLAIDNGTQSLKALVFDLEGQLLAREQIKFTPYYSENPGWAEQDPEVFWRALCQACQGLWSDQRMDKARIAGVTLTTQRGTVVNVDDNGNLDDAYALYTDQGVVHLGDELELKIFDPLPGNLEVLNKAFAL